jgi:DNA-binding NtrC family response regulator
MLKPTLLLVDDDFSIVEILKFSLRHEFDVYSAESREGARRLLQTLPRQPVIALIDLGLPPNPHQPEEGFALVSELLNFNQAMKILVLSGQDSKPNILHALTLGAVDFIPKPCDTPLLLARLKHQLIIYEAEQEKPQNQETDCGIIGESLPMLSLKSQTQQFADSPFPVLIMGESGSGKELVAQCLHTSSSRKNANCLTINCAAFTADLLDAQLFGHAKGAYTGAAGAKTGFFEDAENGSLILDEIGEMPLELQSKLLRVLENGEYYRLGETKVRKSNARIIASTNRDLRDAVRKGSFRNDLYHRLTVLTIRVPLLCERSEDKLILLKHFQTFYSTSMGKKPFELDSYAQDKWRTYNFPGNVRELRNIVIRLSTKYAGQTVNIEQLEAELEEDFSIKTPSELDQSDNIESLLLKGNFSLDDAMLEWERRYIEIALKMSQQNLSQAARLLGINRTTLYSKMQRLAKNEN